MQAYQYLDKFVEGDKVWYQPINANSWHGRVIVLCHRGQSVGVLASGKIKKIAVCKVKSYELIDRENSKQPAVKEETVEPVEQEEAQKKATADFQEREKKVAEEIAIKPETEIGDSNPEPEGI